MIFHDHPLQLIRLPTQYFEVAISKIVCWAFVTGFCKQSCSTQLTSLGSFDSDSQKTDMNTIQYNSGLHGKQLCHILSDPVHINFNF